MAEVGFERGAIQVIAGYRNVGQSHYGMNRGGDNFTVEYDTEWIPSGETLLMNR